MPPSTAKRPIRVLLMASSMRGGGSEQQTAMLARHLDRSRFEVHLFLTHRVGELLETLPFDVTIHSPPVFPDRWSDRIPGSRLRRQAKWLGRLVADQQVDVIYDRTFHMTLLAGHPAATRAMGMRKVRRVSTIVSPPEVAVPMVEKRFVFWKRRRLCRAYHDSASIIAVSRAAAESAGRYYGLADEQITVIANPIDQRHVCDGVLPQPDTRTGGSRREWVVACVGRMTPEKGQADLLEALRLAGPRWPEALPKLRVRFVGDGPDHRRLRAIWDAMRGSGETFHGHRVDFAGTVSPATGEIAAADLLVLPSHFEGMPNVVLEAYALRTPVLATRSGGTAELIADSEGPAAYDCRPGAPIDLAAALEKTCLDHANWPTRIARGLKILAENHDLQTAVSKISDLLTRASVR